MIDQLEKLEKSQRVFNLQLMLDYNGEVRPQEKEPAKDEKINEFRYVCYIIIYCTPEKFGGNNAWRKNRSGKRPLIVTTNLDGFI